LSETDYEVKFFYLIFFDNSSFKEFDKYIGSENNKGHYNKIISGLSSQRLQKNANHCLVNGYYYNKSPKLNSSQYRLVDLFR